MEHVGVCYSSNNSPPPRDVIRRLNFMNIKKMRIYEPSQAVPGALGFNVFILGVPNEDIRRIATDDSAATTWVQKNVRAYINDVCFLCYIAVGNGVQPSDLETAPHVLLAMRKINKEIEKVNLSNQVKVSTAIDLNILGDFVVPSQATFSNEAREYIEPIINFLVQVQAPLLANVQPYNAYVNQSTRSFSLDFALFTSTDPNDTINDGGFAYKNLFDFLLDGIYCAVENLGSQRLEIIVSATGWPSAERRDANILNAIIYYINLIRHVTVGTPRRQRPIETYLSDENKNFGLFNPVGQPSEEP